MNQVLTQSVGFNLSKDPETGGFDLQAGQSWIYPTNYPIREYQFNIVQKALLSNTLVSLPTGLGKTFIAAVVMYNFFRWYPLGKVIFMAPTRPLVKQQIDACYDIMAIPKEVTVELTGSKIATHRGDIWKEKRVFFVTPQILQNDLDKLEELGPKIKCIVFDEAHRARGNHAYCEVVRKLVVHNKFFRVLALSATPGSCINDVLEVVHNLLISHLEFRTEESADVHPYVYERNLTTVVVPLGEKLQKVRDNYLQILEYYTKVLMKYKVIQGNCGSLTKGKIFMTMKEFQRNRNSSSANYAEIMKSLNICVTLYHAFELLTRHGLRSFLSFFNEHIDKPLLRGNSRLVEIMNDIKEYLGPEPNVEQLPDGSYPEIPKTVKFGHPKFYKLRDILVSHFTAADDSSRVIVFFEYRNSVTEAYMLLIQARPVLKPRIFLGQGQGVTQRLQLNVVKSFREGQCNILLSTCIGEEGLDVGDVDLIVCFDISNKSPIRMVQRMGRTGRKKEGHVIVLVTEGKEQQILKDCLIHKNNIAFHVLSSKELAKGLKSSSPRLIPAEISPKCEKIFITVKKPTLTKNSSLKEMFRTISSSSSEPVYSPDLEVVEIPERIPQPQMLWNKEEPLNKNVSFSNVFCKKIGKQRSLQPIHKVCHSKNSETLVELLQLVDSRRFNIPMTQIGTTSQLTQNKNLKQGDIRNMFLKSQPSSDVVLPGSQATKIAPSEETSPEENYLMESRELFSEISNFLSIQMSSGVKKCRHCPDNFDCSTFIASVPDVDVIWAQVDDSILNTISLDDINLFTESLTPKSNTIYKLEFDDFMDSSLISSTQHNQKIDIFENLKITQLEKIAAKLDKNADIDSGQLEEEVMPTSLDAGEKSYTYQAPKTLDLLLNKYSTSIIEIDSQEKQIPASSTTNALNSIDEQEILKFFKLKTLTELFGDESKISDSQETILYSPDLFDSTMTKNKLSEMEKDNTCKQESEDELHLSPVLRKFERGRNVRKTTPRRPNLLKLQLQESKQVIETPSKFTMNGTKISSTPFENKVQRNDNLVCLTEPKVNSVQSDLRKEVNLGQISSSSSPRKNDTLSKIDIDDVCDLSVFGLSPVKNTATASTSKQSNVVNLERNVKDQRSNSLFSSSSSATSFDVDDFCDLMSFGLASQKNTNHNNETSKRTSPVKNHFHLNPTDIDLGKRTNCPEKASLNEGLDLGDFVSPTNRNDLSLPGGYQSQLPITQLLSLINRNDGSPSTNLTPQKQNSDLKGNESPDDHRKKTETPAKKRRLSINKTVQSPSPAKPQARKNLNESFNRIVLADSANSDDDFDERPPSPVFRRPQPVSLQTSDRKRDIQSDRSLPPKPVKRKKTKNPFIEEEAELSEDEAIHVSEDEEEEEDQSVYETSFVADETQHIDTQMHARYLQSLMSPTSRNRGQFKIPQRPKFIVGNVYSQEVNHDEDTYLEDSFVVDDEDEQTQQELSVLEILEQKLREQKKRKKSDGDTETAKRRRIMRPSDDSD